MHQVTHFIQIFLRSILSCWLLTLLTGCKQAYTRNDVVDFHHEGNTLTLFVNRETGESHNVTGVHGTTTIHRPELHTIFAVEYKLGINDEILSSFSCRQLKQFAVDSKLQTPKYQIIKYQTRLVILKSIFSQDSEIAVFENEILREKVNIPATENHFTSPYSSEGMFYDPETAAIMPNKLPLTVINSRETPERKPWESINKEATRMFLGDDGDVLIQMTDNVDGKKVNVFDSKGDIIEEKSATFPILPQFRIANGETHILSYQKDDTLRIESGGKIFERVLPSGETVAFWDRQNHQVLFRGRDFQTYDQKSFETPFTLWSYKTNTTKSFKLSWKNFEEFISTASK